MNNKNKSKFNKSQSLVEVVIVAGILAYLFVAIALLLGTVLKGAQSVSQRMKAEAYAQEAMEGIRNIRDSNLIAGNTFSDGFQPNGAKILRWKGGAAIEGNFDQTGFMLVPGASESIESGRYIRTIDISGAGSSTTLTVTVKIMWNSGRNSITLKDYLTNWKQ